MLNTIDHNSYSIKKLLRRKNFGRVTTTTKIPNLILTQKESYNNFLQMDIPPHKRENKGLEGIFRFVFPLSDFENKATLEYVRYNLFTPKYDLQECTQRGINYSASLSITVRLVIWETGDDGEKEIKSIKEQDVFMGEIPLMTDNGTFMINGAQRVIVSQMHRSPGVFYTHDGGKNNSIGKYLYSASIMPYRGSWLDFEFDNKDILFCRVDRKRKIYITTLLKALGFTRDQILSTFYNVVRYEYKNFNWVRPLDLHTIKGAKLDHDCIDAETGDVIFKADIKITPRMIRMNLDNQGRKYLVSKESIIGRYVSQTVYHPRTGDVVMEGGQEITPAIFEYLTNDLEMKVIDVLDIDHITHGAYMRNTLALDRNISQQDALYEIFTILKNAEPPSFEIAQTLLHNRFFDRARYDLSAVGRMKLNMKHDLSIPTDMTCLTQEDIVAVLKHLIELRDSNGEVDDIDSLSNRRVRPVGELIENQFRLGLVRIERSIIEKMNSSDLDSVMPHDLINSKALSSIIHEFFGTSQLSQFMDQINPLAEVTHKRRVSALGPGGLSRDRASMAVRDVHLTHYGRICPVETPEGQNTGLINSLATYAGIDQYGFIDTPYYKVENGKVTRELHRVSAIVESKYIIAQATAAVDENGMLIDELVSCRRYGEFGTASPEEVQYIDVAPKQLISVAASLIPFLENDDANRALMGANMQRQAVPLIKSRASLVGTGMEKVVASDSGAVVVAKRSGVVEQVDAKKIVIRADESGLDDKLFGIDLYKLIKYQKSNKSTCINQIPRVDIGDRVEEGDVIADGTSTDNGELALGKDVLVAFMPWNGYNFEDSILISQRVVQEDEFSSIHIQEYEVVARDTRLGPEEITRQLPGAAPEALLALDEDGIIIIGSQVEAGDVLVGKVTPKTESILTPEEKLLRAIFGEKAAEVRDTSLRVPPGESGVVIDVRVFNRRGVEKNERAILIEKAEIEQLTRDFEGQIQIIDKAIDNKLFSLVSGQPLTVSYMGFEVGTIVTEKVFYTIDLQHRWSIPVGNNMDLVRTLQSKYITTKKEFEEELKHKIEKVQSSDHFPQGALKIVKIYIARKLRLQPGDKMAGRHGNKGVVSKVLPIEDMPFLEDGTPVDIALNPIGVPSRMNIGQIFETHLGWAAKNLGKQIGIMVDKINQEFSQERITEIREKLLAIYDGVNAHDMETRVKMEAMSDQQIVAYAANLRDGVPMSTPPFDGATDAEISNLLINSGVSSSGQTRLLDGRTGEYFDREVTVGYIHMLKLDHLVSYKKHARSTGPYNLVTQQPLGGKQHFGGQRLGEMECWALEAYGAAYTLQEMLTVKSDDIPGRIKIYENIIRNDLDFEYGTPESFSVMIKEIRSLGLNIELLTDEKKDN